MFEINDYIIYGGNGIHKILDIGTINISGIDKERLYYTLKSVNSNGGTSYTPIDNEKVVLRKILSKKEALEIIDEIPNIGTIYIEDEKL
jgi:CarD family transcriptional regulator